MAKSLNVRNTHGEVRMTDGSLWKNMLIFSAPLMLSQLLRVLFNMADVAVVGKFSSAEALCAVGSTTILVTLFTGFLIGMGSAVNVRVAQHLGAKDKARTSASIRTSFVLCLATGCIIMALCLVSARFMLELLGTKDDLIEGAVLGAALFLFGEEFLSLFANDRAVIEAGLQRTGIMCFSYAFSAFMDCTIAACRGIGKSFAPTVIVIMGSCVFRVVWIYTVFAYFRTIPSLYLLYIFSWVITSVAEIVYFAISYKKLNTADVLKT